MNHNSNENICLNTRIENSDPSIFPFQFVYETTPVKLSYPIIQQTYCSIFLVTEGCGSLVSKEKTISLKTGDLFFVFAGTSYSFTDIINLKYIYISFVGQNLPKMLADFGILEPITCFSGYHQLTDQWFTALGLCNDNNLPTLMKGLLYYALALLPASMNAESSHVNEHNIISQICNLLDHSFGNSNLSLEYVCLLYNYNPNYISRRFHKEIGCSFTDYLVNCRIRHAKKLLLETELPIQTISAGVGYSNAMYFSRVFRKKTGMSPSNFRHNGK